MARVIKYQEKRIDEMHVQSEGISSNLKPYQHPHYHEGGEISQVEDILSSLHVFFVSNSFLELFWTLLMGIYNLMLIQN
jgi:hypothetical protein